MDVWVGGATSMVTSVVRQPTGVDANSFGTFGQAELGLRLGTGPLYFRLDLDLLALAPDPDGAGLGFPEWAVLDNGLKLGPPEFAMLQYGTEDFALRGGIITHQIGLEDFDEWKTYFPTKSTMYITLPGRMAGAEAGLFVGDFELFAFGGYDFDYAVEADSGWTGGAGITTLQDFWGTWSGIAAYPNLDIYEAVLALEFYVLPDDLWISVDGTTGVAGIPDETGASTFYGWFGGEVVVNVIPTQPVQPVFRFQGLVDPNDALFGLPTLSGSASLTMRPFDELKIAIEGKASKVGEDVVPGIFGQLSFFRPEPPPYSAKYPEEEPAAEARRRGPRTAPQAPTAGSQVATRAR